LRTTPIIAKVERVTRPRLICRFALSLRASGPCNRPASRSSRAQARAGGRRGPRSQIAASEGRRGQAKTEAAPAQQRRRRSHRAAEARISAADANRSVIAAQCRSASAPPARAGARDALLGGLRSWRNARRSLAILDQGSTQEFVRVRLLLDSTLPVIRARTASLRPSSTEAAAPAAARRRATSWSQPQHAAASARDFSRLEAKASRSPRTRRRGPRAGDVALRAGKSGAAPGEAQRRTQARAIAAESGAPPAPPGTAGTAGTCRAFAYMLPRQPRDREAWARSPNGVRSRGLTLATAAEPSVASGSGTIRFRGPFRSYDAVVIIDHGEAG
jgi:hypothetical protein